MATEKRPMKTYENQWKTYGKAMEKLWKTYENEWLNPPSPKNSWQLIYCH